MNALSLAVLMRVLLWMLIFCLFIHTSNAQRKVDGKVMEYKLDVVLTGIKVENLNQHVVTITDEKGKFTIEAKTGDLICFSGLEYQPDTVYLANLRYKEVYLTLQQHQLNEVNVKSAEANKNAFSIPPLMTPFGGDVVRYQTDAAGNPIGGIKFNLFDSNKDARKRERARKLEVDGQKQLEIEKVFNAKNLQSYLPISGQELNNFIIIYMPDVKTYYSSKFNLLMYLNDSYKSFLKIPVDTRRSNTFFQLNNKN